MQIPTPNNIAQPPIPAVPPQIARALVQPPAMPVLTLRAIDPNDHGGKGHAAGSAAQRPASAASAGKRSSRGSHLNVLV